MMAATRPTGAKDSRLLARYSAAFGQHLEQHQTETALRVAQRAAEENAAAEQKAKAQANEANNQLRLEMERRLQTQSQLDFLTTHDALTGLPNRGFFSDRIIEAASLSRENGGRFALMYLDIDHFKDLNDTLGHETGDILLREVGSRLRSCLSGSDTLSRLGGDEFGILQVGVPDADVASALARHVLASLAAPFSAGGRQVFVSASIGITMYPADGSEPALLNRNADLAMYRCKQDGRNGYKFFDSALDAEVHRRSFLEQALRAALQNGEMSLAYQPQVSLQSGAMTGVEALLRWNSPVVGPIPPDEFIPVAERCGLIAELGLWVLRQACRQLVDWDAAGLPAIVMAVNLSVPQLKLVTLPDLVEEVLRETGLPPSRLEMEITETEIMRDMKTAVDTLTRLRKLGIKLAIDDFGTGYSSLSYLRRLPVDKIKIDKSFITDVTHNTDAASVTRTIVMLARNLRLNTIAEGIETVEQEAFLRDVGCHYGQGYYYGRPCTAAELAVKLTTPTFGKENAQ